MKKMKTTIKLTGLFLVLLVAISALAILVSTPTEPSAQILRFKTGQDLVDAFENARNQGGGFWYGGMMKGAIMEMASTLAPTAAAADSSASGSRNTFSETNVQVQGVDEADMIKTDGEYIYMVANGKLVIALAYPGEEAKILSETKFEEFSPDEIFIDGDRLMLFGSSYKQLYEPKPVEGADDIVEESGAGEAGVAIDIAIPEPAAKIAVSSIGRYMPYYGGSATTVKLYDIFDKENPKLVRNIDFEGSYLTSRKIGEEVYFVLNSYPHPWLKGYDPAEIMPVYAENDKVMPLAQPTEVGYVEPLTAQNFISVISLSMTDEDKEFGKEIIAGNGQNVYASLENLYVAQLTYPTYGLGELVEDFVPKTVVTKFALDEGDISFVGTGQVNGRILNQFSMDEFESNFRIATTIEGYDSENSRDTSTNNMYVLDEDLTQIGAVEKIAPGESIYSVRFMGDRAYMVTFKHVDPLFVIDLSEPTDPKILGKLKIPGYSEYLHPYDENHLIGIGKEVDESIDADKVHTEGAVYYTAIQGVKLAIFDVSDVSNPIELHKEVIGDRGTNSAAETDHKAFLFDKEKGLLVIPIAVAELKPGQDKSQEGEFVFQGAYVYDVNLEDGFDLKGKVTHIDDLSVFDKAGSYFYDYASMIQRSLYINDILYTFSNKRLQLNDLDSLDKIKELDLGASESPYYGDYPVRTLMIE